MLKLFYGMFEELSENYYFNNYEYFNNKSNSQKLKYRIAWFLFKRIDKILNK